MANTIHVDIVSAEGQIFSGEATMVFVPGSQGELGIAPRHAPLLTTLKAGEVRVQSEGARRAVVLCGRRRARGSAAIASPCSPTPPRGPRIWTRRLRSPRNSAPRTPCASARDKVDIAEAQAELARAMAQLRAIERLRKKR